jgi:hypothetical protein
MKVKDKVAVMVDNQVVLVSRKVWKQAQRVANDLAKRVVQISDASSRAGVPAEVAEEQLYKHAKKLAGKHGFRVMQVALWLWRKMLKNNLDQHKKWRGVRIMYEPVERYCMDYSITQFRKTDSYKRVKDVEEKV